MVVGGGEEGGIPKTMTRGRKTHTSLCLDCSSWDSGQIGLV